VSSSSGSTAPRSRSRRGTPSGFFNAHGDNFIFYNKGYDDHIHTQSVLEGNRSIVLCMRTCLLRRPGPEGRRHRQRVPSGYYYIAQKNDSQQIDCLRWSPPRKCHVFELIWYDDPTRSLLQQAGLKK
jgi:hypothetical protein